MLEKDGFVMMQFSVYVRHCPSKENMDVHVKRVEMSIPVSGQVSILAVTDKQYGDIHNFIGQKVSSLVRGPVQLELF
jgi:CRISPR-associated protein Cas2